MLVVLVCNLCLSCLFCWWCSCKDMPQVVWSNLKAHQYRDDLTRPGVEDTDTASVEVTHPSLKLHSCFGDESHLLPVS